MQGAVVERVDPPRLCVRVHVDDELDPRLGGEGVAEGVHVPELPAGVDVEQREWQRHGKEGLPRQMQKDRRILAHRIEQHRPVGLGGRLAQDEDAFGLEPVEMGQLLHFASVSAGGRQKKTGGTRPPVLECKQVQNSPLIPARTAVSLWPACATPRSSAAAALSRYFRDPPIAYSPR